MFILNGNASKWMSTSLTSCQVTGLSALIAHGVFELLRKRKEIMSVPQRAGVDEVTMIGSFCTSYDVARASELGPFVDRVI